MLKIDYCEVLYGAGVKGTAHIPFGIGYTDSAVGPVGYIRFRQGLFTTALDRFCSSCFIVLK